MAVTIEVSQGRYLRHLRELAGYNQRQLMAALNEMLPPSERKTHQWIAALEVDRTTRVSLPMAIAMRELIGAQFDDLGIDDAEVAKYRALFGLLDEPSGEGKNRGRDRPKRSSSCIAYPVQARPSLPLVCRISNAALVAGGRRADRA